MKQIFHLYGTDRSRDLQPRFRRFLKRYPGFRGSFASGLRGIFRGFSTVLASRRSDSIINHLHGMLREPSDFCESPGLECGIDARAACHHMLSVRQFEFNPKLSSGK